MRKRFYSIFMIIIVLIPLVFHPVSFYGDTVIDKEAVDQFVTSYMKNNGLPGASIVIVKDGKFVYETSLNRA